jgi:hypothetical protein
MNVVNTVRVGQHAYRMYRSDSAVETYLAVALVVVVGVAVYSVYNWELSGKGSNGGAMTHA